MKFVFFPVSENGEMDLLGDEGADGGNAPPRIFGLEPPLGQTESPKHHHRYHYILISNSQQC